MSDGVNGLIVRRPFMRRAVEQVPSTVGGGAAQTESVVVSGFRSSLEQSLDMKRQSLDSSDSILAEDIAKFPDLNVSESLQRIPGITLARDQGGRGSACVASHPLDGQTTGRLTVRSCGPAGRLRVCFP